MHAWTRIVQAIVAPRARAASYLGIGVEELESLGAVAAVEAELSWDPTGGRSLSSWVYLNVEWVIRRRMARIAREFADEDLDEWAEDPDPDPEARTIVWEALGYLQAQLSGAQWWLLWMFHGQGYTSQELASRLGLADGTVRNRLSDARKKAMTLLADREECRHEQQ